MRKLTARRSTARARKASRRNTSRSLVAGVQEAADTFAALIGRVLDDPNLITTVLGNAAVKASTALTSQSVPAISDAVVAHVVSEWRRNPRYCDERGVPRLLPLRGGRLSIAQLLRRTGLRLDVETVAGYLLETQTTRKVGAQFELLQPWVSLRGLTEKLQFRTLQVIVDSLRTLDQNLQEGARALVERTADHPSVPKRMIPDVFRFADREALGLLRRVDEFLDRCAATAKPDEPTLRMGINVKQIQGPALEFVATADSKGSSKRPMTRRKDPWRAHGPKQ
jgi:hypothetical protein